MNTKTRIKNLYNLAPEYPRIPHLDKKISNMTHDDIQLDGKIQFPITGWFQEKLDGANMGVSWTSGPVIRNRNNILKKGYIKKETPAKLQFRSSWNWLHAHNKDIQKLSKSLMTPVTVYGEWLYAKHSIYYDRLPDLFIAYDIYIPEDDEWLSPDKFESEMSQTDIRFIKPTKMTFNDISDVVRVSELPSDYRNGIREGIVIKLSDGRKVTQSFKIVNKFFDRREDFNEELIKNKVIS
jgi:atypical dual specificity phosphatase